MVSKEHNRGNKMYSKSWTFSYGRAFSTEQIQALENYGYDEEDVYNQWIKDNAQLTIGWILNLANLFMTDQLKTQNKDKFINKKFVAGLTLEDENYLEDYEAYSNKLSQLHYLNINI